MGGHSAYITAKGRQELRRSPIVGDDRDESTPRRIKVVPKGLRSFDAEDKDFFLELLPGPRRGDGLPESIHFWKTRIEEMDPDKTFSVGVIYGPSGCGKSSLVKAGMLPRLADSVIRIYVEATANDTEARLLRELRKHVPNLPTDLALPESVRALQEGQFDQRSKKDLVVIDQFEQWLHAKRLEEAPELVQALRHCDGRRVQAIVMVRVDFWMALTRFMGKLEIELHQGQNFVAVDLFDQDHARKVLTLFGQAFGKVSDTLDNLTEEQRAFFDQAIAGLALEDGKVVSVPGPLRRDGQGQAVDPDDFENRWRHGGRRCFLPGRDVLFAARQPEASVAPESGSSCSESPPARRWCGYQGQHDVATDALGSLGLFPSSERF